VKTAFCLRRLENGERSSSTTEMKQATTVGRDSLVVAAAKAEEVAELVVAVTEALCRDEALSGVTPVTALAERKKAWAAAMSRCSLSMVSRRLPLRSIARYR
jgi:hypothetical protein